MIAPKALMQLAIDKAREGIEAGQSPFGCAIARGDDLIAVSHNTVVATTDVTAHAEVNALRLGCKTTGQIHLEGCVVATTCEPCPMCMAALHWARVETVYFGASIADADSAGFNELQVPAAEVLKIGGSKVALVSGVLSAECRDLFQRWLQRSDRVVY
ncbi:MAG TPA: nucleoside deaminase [Pirellulaceae bacterium]|nr:nucleoside deaminase [Planctomycetales bacterium]MCB9938839.1 nucleoside deaminase [Planctomycetaceae bacterium]HRX83365.1 nucleoside deaminase [Pirellulaceae bacterium]